MTTPAPPEPPTTRTRRSLLRVEAADARQREALRRLAEADEEIQLDVLGDAADAELEAEGAQ